MKKKNLISLSVAFAFLALSITGILLYVKQKAHAVEMTHTIFGLIFVSFAIFHIIFPIKRNPPNSAGHN